MPGAESAPGLAKYFRITDMGSVAHGSTTALKY
jgi:hypothetical protein